MSGSVLSPPQLWELATGRLKLTLTGHISAVRALTVSPRQPYLFSAGEDKQVKCWDLEHNKVMLTSKVAQYSPAHVNLATLQSLCSLIDSLISPPPPALQVVRHYHGHLSGVYCMSLHPTIDVLVTGSRDSTARVQTTVCATMVKD